MSASEGTIRLRAYELWDRAGRPNGRNDEFWFAAKAELEPKEQTREGRLIALARRRAESSGHETAADCGKRAHGSRLWE